MLSGQEKREMLQDAKSKIRRDSFRAAQDKAIKISFDEYIKVLDDLQKIFSPFKISTYITPTRFNKL